MGRLWRGASFGEAQAELATLAQQLQPTREGATRLVPTLFEYHLADALWPGTSPIGRSLFVGSPERRRVRDCGIRIALGASPGRILSSALAEGLSLTALGLVIGLALGVATGRSARSLLHGVTLTDPPTYAGVLALLSLASLIACYVPAHRAARINPTEALRHE